MNWHNFWLKILLLSCFLMLLVFIFIILINPYDNLHLKINAERVPITWNQRYSYPAIARKHIFDSAIIGTSTARLLNPEILNSIFNANFVNLSMNSATAHEQSQIFNLFRKDHASIKYILFGIDAVWCDTTENPDQYTPRPFPIWMYDENNRNDYFHMFNITALIDSLRLIQYWFGLRKPKYEVNGYTNFLPEEDEYDLDKAVINLYGSKKNKEQFNESLSVKSAEDKDQKFNFPVHNLLYNMINSLDEDTQKIIFFVPYHYYLIQNNFELYNQCKQKILESSANIKNIHLIDLMFSSEITANDSNYWDTLHYKVSIADKLPKLIHQTMINKKGINNSSKYLK